MSAASGSVDVTVAVVVAWWATAVPGTSPIETLPSPDLAAVPGSRALVKANLQLSRASEQEIRRALKQDPDSASLQRLLTTTETRSRELRRLLAEPA